MSAVLTRESFAEALRVIRDMPRSEPAMIFVNPRVAKALDDWSRTRKLGGTPSYVLLELDGRRWWARREKIFAGGPYRTFPRDRGEGWTSWFVPNRHQRKRGYTGEDLADMAASRRRAP